MFRKEIKQWKMKLQKKTKNCFSIYHATNLFVQFPGLHSQQEMLLKPTLKMAHIMCSRAKDTTHSPLLSVFLQKKYDSPHNPPSKHRGVHYFIMADNKPILR
jgi:hypothetical protein